MPEAVWRAAAGVIKGEIYVVGGQNGNHKNIGKNQIYNPATNTWRTGAPLPERFGGGAGAVVRNVLYVIGSGRTGKAVWAYDPETKQWSAKSPMPTTRVDIGAAAENDIIYVIGGNGRHFGRYDLFTVESYNPATDTWTEEADLLYGKASLSAGLVGTTIVAVDGTSLRRGDQGTNQGYDASTNTWRLLVKDPRPRDSACSGTIGTKFYVAGGMYGANVNVTESFAKGVWEDLASMPHGVGSAVGAVYQGRLFCFGGSSDEGATVNNYVQIYQP